MTQYKSVIVPTSFDSADHSYTGFTDAITKAITEEAKEGWELTLAQEMESGKKKGFLGGLFGKSTEKNTLLVFKKEDKKPEPKQPKEFDYDKFEDIFSKRMDYDKFANVFKKVVEETEITISKKSFEGLKFTAPAPALPMNEKEEQPALPDNEKRSTASFIRALPDNNKKNKKNDKNEKKAKEQDEKNYAIAKVAYDFFSKEPGKPVSFDDIKKACEGKLPEGATDADITTVVNEFVNHEILKKEDDKYIF